MKLIRVKAMVVQEYFITTRSLEVILDAIVYPLITICVFGLLSVYISRANAHIADSMLVGMVLWEIIYITQYSVSVGSLWNIWSRNLSNLFISPLMAKEYLLAHATSGVMKSVFVFIVSSIFLNVFFQFNIFKLGIGNIVIYFLNLTLFAIATGLILLGLIFRFGTRIQAIAWGLLPLLQPLTAALFPVSILPLPLQWFAYALPPTAIFEAARASYANPSIHWNLIAIAFGENIVYILIAILFFQYMFFKSKMTGQFARNET